MTDMKLELVDQPANNDVAVMNNNDHSNTYGPTSINDDSNNDGIDNEENKSTILLSRFTMKPSKPPI